MNTDIQIQWVDPNSLTPSPKNPNHHPDDQIERLGKILKYQGFRSPIVVSKRTNHIVVGHGRCQAAIKAGINKVPVSYQDFDDWDQEYAHMTADNAIAEWASLNFAEINAEIENLGPMDIDLLGLKEFKIDAFEEPAEKAGPKDKDAVLITCPNCGTIIDG